MDFQLLQTDKKHTEKQIAGNLKKLTICNTEATSIAYLAKIITTIGINGFSSQHAAKVQDKAWSHIFLASY